MQFLEQRVDRWSDDEWARRRDRLRETIRQMEAALRESGESVETHGWHYTPTGAWYRFGEPPPDHPEPLVEAWRRVGERVSLEAFQWAMATDPELVALVEKAEERVEAENAERSTRGYRAAAEALPSVFVAVQEAYRQRKPDEPCPICGADAWERRAGIWLCAECQPATGPTAAGTLF